MPPRRSSGILEFLAALILAAGVGALYALKAEWHKPLLRLSPQQATVSTATVFRLEAQDADSGIRQVVVSADLPSGAPVEILKKTYDAPQGAIVEEFSLAALPVKSGKLTLKVAVTDASWHRLGMGNTARLELPLTLDSTPPIVSVTSRQHNVVHGGSGLVVYTANEPLARTGVEVGEYFFPGYLERPGRYLCFFALPFAVDPSSVRPVVLATDEAGNEMRVPINVYVIAKKFRKDSINVSDAFLQSKMPQFAALYPPGTGLVDIFIKVNSELRRQNISQLKEIAVNTVPQMLWSGTFMRLPKSATMAQFGDTRTYLYGGKAIDTQTHMGIDLASIINAPVPAGNTGRVVFAGFLGIYGNMVVLDHGFGVHSLYSHLSEIHVQVGDVVQRGQIIGKTGATGMAGGDHLHFGMLVGGVEVQPIEWWDGHWIHDNITEKLQ
ncbi:MAG: M23 family metallopeptidase [Desulfomicrobiaceae bacterium]|nr:M23 family metallopeptidase [Desulfomicrobiaceae bacterium]